LQPQRALPQGPPDSVRLVAVSKTFAGEAVRESGASGPARFRRDYVTEAVEKIRELRGLGLTWHYIGPVQSNKTG